MLTLCYAGKLFHIKELSGSVNYGRKHRHSDIRRHRFDDQILIKEILISARHRNPADRRFATPGIHQSHKTVDYASIGGEGKQSVRIEQSFLQAGAEPVQQRGKRWCRLTVVELATMVSFACAPAVLQHLFANIKQSEPVWQPHQPSSCSGRFHSLTSASLSAEQDIRPRELYPCR